MHLKPIAFAVALICLPFTAVAIEGWGVDEQIQEPAQPQSQLPQEPEAIEEEFIESETGIILEETDKTENLKLEAVPAAEPAEEEEPEIAEEEAPKWKETSKAKLQGLNKVTARTSEIKLDIGKTTKFGNLEIKIEKCLRGPADEKVENTALITIWDEIPGQQRREVFHGWMFSSSPSISALEHPIYDVILQSCNNEQKPAETPKADDKTKDAKDGKAAEKKK